VQKTIEVAKRTYEDKRVDVPVFKYVQVPKVEKVQKEIEVCNATLVQAHKTINVQVPRIVRKEADTPEPTMNSVSQVSYREKVVSQTVTERITEVVEVPRISSSPVRCEELVTELPFPSPSFPSPSGPSFSRPRSLERSGSAESLAVRIGGGYHVLDDEATLPSRMSAGVSTSGTQEDVEKKKLDHRTYRQVIGGADEAGLSPKTSVSQLDSPSLQYAYVHGAPSRSTSPDRYSVGEYARGVANRSGPDAVYRVLH
jgi:hypothetical protein